jgi:hypothetical protein
MQETTHQPQPEIDVQCVEAPDGVLTVVIRTLTDADLERMARIPRREPKRVH